MRSRLPLHDDDGLDLQDDPAVAFLRDRSSHQVLAGGAELPMGFEPLAAAGNPAPAPIAQSLAYPSDLGQPITQDLVVAAGQTVTPALVGSYAGYFIQYQ